MTGSFADEAPDGKPHFSLCCPPQLKDPNLNLSDFKVEKSLGTGYVSMVLLATHIKSGLKCAVKVYNRARLSELNLRQVYREIEIHSGLSHKNIVDMFAAFHDAQAFYLVLEYCPKGDLFAELKRRGGRLTERIAVTLVLHPFMAALNYLHQRSIVHRDIKPENILFTEDNTLKIADFGLSINVEEERPVTRLGTLDYMAPEVLRCPTKKTPEENKEKANIAYNFAVDSWACGVLAYELLVGRAPFERSSKEETYMAIITGQMEIPAWISEEAHEFIKMSLTQDPKLRPLVRDLIKERWIEMHRRRNSVLAPGAGLKDSPAYAEAIRKLNEQQQQVSPTTNLPGIAPVTPNATTSGSGAGGGGGLASHLQRSLNMAKIGGIRGGNVVPGQRTMSTLGVPLAQGKPAPTSGQGPRLPGLSQTQSVQSTNGEGGQAMSSPRAAALNSNGPMNPAARAMMISQGNASQSTSSAGFNPSTGPGGAKVSPRLGQPGATREKSQKALGEATSAMSAPGARNPVPRRVNTRTDKSNGGGLGNGPSNGGDILGQANALRQPSRHHLDPEAPRSDSPSPGPVRPAPVQPSAPQQEKQQGKLGRLFKRFMN